jgi:hypothetical protein
MAMSEMSKFRDFSSEIQFLYITLLKATPNINPMLIQPELYQVLYNFPRFGTE